MFLDQTDPFHLDLHVEEILTEIMNDKDETQQGNSLVLPKFSFPFQVSLLFHIGTFHPNLQTKIQYDK